MGIGRWTTMRTQKKDPGKIAGQARNDARGKKRRTIRSFRAGLAAVLAVGLVLTMGAPMSVFADEAAAARGAAASAEASGGDP
ncbi:MAG: hypothetical protein LBB46_05070, partial [Coriobacteriaceae bacterium]|nr:hypothetical protein [Coriobacteriaceae bacterium]